MAKHQCAEPCEDARPALLTLEDHAYQLYVLTTPDGFAYSGDAGVDRWLILAAGLSEVSVVTNGLDPQDVYCSNIFEEARGDAVTAVATELTRLLFIWGAVECLVRDTLPRRGSRDEGTAKRLSRFVDACSPALEHHQCAARNLLRSLEAHTSQEFRAVAEEAGAFRYGDAWAGDARLHEDPEPLGTWRRPLAG